MASSSSSSFSLSAIERELNHAEQMLRDQLADLSEKPQDKEILKQQRNEIRQSYRNHLIVILNKYTVESEAKTEIDEASKNHVHKLIEAIRIAANEQANENNLTESIRLYRAITDANLNLNLRESILKQVNEDLWGVEVMTCAVAEKAVRRSITGRMNKVFVLERRDEDAENKQEELALFVYKLHRNIDFMLEGTRFQLAIKTGVHWTACDLIINKERTAPILFVLDAANATQLMNGIYNTFKAKFPGIKIYTYTCDEIPKPGTQDEVLPRMMQMDKINCSRFTLHHLFRLSQIDDLFDKLTAIPFKSIKSDPNFFRINPENCPDFLAPIFNNTQSRTVAESLPERLKRFIVSLSGQTLEGHIKAHSKESKGGAYIPDAINVKREAYTKRIQQFVISSGDEQLERLLRYRTGYRYLHDILGRGCEEDEIEEKHNPSNSAKYLLDQQMLRLINLAKSNPGLASTIQADVEKLKLWKIKLDSAIGYKAVVDVLKKIKLSDKAASTKIQKLIDKNLWIIANVVPESVRRERSQVYWLHKDNVDNAPIDEFTPMIERIRNNDPSLLCLDLRKFKTTDSVVRRVTDAFLDNRTISTIHLNGNAFSILGANYLYDAFSQGCGQEVQKLTMDGSYLTRTMIDTPYGKMQAASSCLDLQNRFHDLIDSRHRIPLSEMPRRR